MSIVGALIVLAVIVYIVVRSEMEHRRERPRVTYHKTRWWR